MKNYLVLTFLFLIFISACTPTGEVVYDLDELVLDGPYLVTYTVDGDTADVTINGETERLRFSGINTPETGECYYQEAKDKLTELILNKNVYLEKDKTDEGKYGRLLRYVYLDENNLVNEILVEQGYARVYDKYSYDTKRYEQLKQAEARAQNKNLGVWSCTDKFKDCLYVGSKNSDKYYPPTCKWAKKIKEENKICFNSEEEVKDRIPGQC
ncbi:MAG: thermonuclease family protein [Candidatus Woesearchaeota archaeon]